MTNNKYLTKIAGFRVPTFNHKRERDILDLAGFGMSATGLGVGVNSYSNNKKNLSSSQEKADLETKSLAALNKINKTLASTPVVKIDTGNKK